MLSSLPPSRPRHPSPSSNSNNGSPQRAGSASSDQPRSNPRSPSRREDNSIRRGAEIIRQQIQAQMMELDERIRQHSEQGDRSSASARAMDASSDSILPPRPHQHHSSSNSRESPRPSWSNEYDYYETSDREESEEQQQQRPPKQPQQPTRERQGGGASQQLNDIVRGSRSGEEFSDFSDPWTRDLSGKRTGERRSSDRTNSNNNNNTHIVNHNSAEWSYDADELSQTFEPPQRTSSSTPPRDRRIVRTSSSRSSSSSRNHRMRSSSPRTRTRSSSRSPSQRNRSSSRSPSQRRHTRAPSPSPPIPVRGTYSNVERESAALLARARHSIVHNDDVDNNNDCSSSTDDNDIETIAESVGHTFSQPDTPALTPLLTQQQLGRLEEKVVNSSSGSKSAHVSPPSWDTKKKSINSPMERRQDSVGSSSYNSKSFDSSSKSKSFESSKSRGTSTDISDPIYAELNDSLDTSFERQPRSQQKNSELGAIPSSMSKESGLASYLPGYLKSPTEVRAAPMSIQPHPNMYVGNFDDDFDFNEHYDSPSKHSRPISSVAQPTRSVNGTVSVLSSPGTDATRKKPVASKLCDQYDALLVDPAYQHAQSAGFLWQSLVGQHVKFPSTWWDGDRGPPIGETNTKWMYYGRCSVNKNRILNQLVRGRASAGRLLLHIIVQDTVSGQPVQDVAVGAFHPNAKEVRTTGSALRSLEQCRDVWLAVRKRSANTLSAVDSLWGSDGNWPNGGMCVSRSPMGSGRRITNVNCRSIFGDKAPLETIFLAEDELFERLEARREVKIESPPMAILKEFVFA